MFKENIIRFIKAHGIAVLAVAALAVLLKVILHYSFILSFIILLVLYFGIGFAIELITEKYRLNKAQKQLKRAADNGADRRAIEAHTVKRQEAGAQDGEETAQQPTYVAVRGRTAQAAPGLKKLSSDMQSIIDAAPEGGNASADASTFSVRTKKRDARAENAPEPVIENSNSRERLLRRADRVSFTGADNDELGENTSDFIKKNDMIYKKYASRNAAAEKAAADSAAETEPAADAIPDTAPEMAAETVNVPEVSGDKTDTEAPPVLNKGTDPVSEPAANTVPETPAAENTAPEKAAQEKAAQEKAAPEAQAPKETDAVTLPAPGELLFTHPDIDGDTEFSEGITEAVDRIVEESRPSPIRRHRYSLIRRDSAAEKTALPEATESELEEEAEKREIRSHISKNIDRTNTLFGADPEGGEPSDMVRADSEVVSSLFPERKREKHVKPSLEEYRRRKENISHTRLDFTRNSKKGTDPDVKDQAANGAEEVSEAVADAAKAASMPELKPEAAPKAETAAAPETDAPAAETETDSGGRVRLPLLEKQYELPPVDLLSGPRGTDNVGVVNAEDDPKAQKLINTLESFGVGARITGVMRGPAVTRYELQPNPGIKVSRIVALSDDIALNLASTGVRIEAPIPGKEAIGIEVPNQQVEIVALRQVIESSEFRNSASPLSVALGRDIAGKNIVADIAKMPHLLIAGATGSGKSVCINTIVASVLYKAGPADVRMIMIDPKIVELGVYNGIPHLLVPVVTNPKKAAGALSWAVQEMEQRYTAFSEQNVRDIRAYNALAESRKDLTKMPQILIIIDELADLMMVAAKEIEESIIRLAQKARAAGLHIIIATQRPSVDVITGLIKANIPSRIAFAVTSQIDSRTILDGGGAEKLLGRGDMLFHPIGMSKPLRVQGAFVSDSEIEALADSVRSSYGTALYSSDIQQSIDQKDKDKDKDKNQASGGADNGEDDADADLEMIDAAAQLALEYKQLSTSFLQRKLRLGYSRASRIVDFLEAEGLISSADGSKPRQLLMTREEWEQHRAEAEPKA